MVDGKEYKTVEAEFGSEIVLIDEPVKDGYTFSGWQTEYKTVPDKDIVIVGTFTKEL